MIPRVALSRVVSRAAAPRGCAVAAAPTPAQRVRYFSAAARLVSTLESEIKHEKESYKAPALIGDFTSSKEWKFEHKGGDVNLKLSKKVGNKFVTVEWQPVSPYDSAMDEQANEGEEADTPIDFSLSVENEAGAGMTFFCQTQKGENHRFLIGNVKAFVSSEERDSVSAFNGPDFEDLDDKLQESLDEYLADLGVDDRLCDFIDAVAADKEQEEYLRWLQTAKKFVE